jgi:hypothetical protein
MDWPSTSAVTNPGTHHEMAVSLTEQDTSLTTQVATLKSWEKVALSNVGIQLRKEEAKI